METVEIIIAEEPASAPPPVRVRTKITVNYDCGFSRALFIRGEGLPELSWECGIPLKNVKADEWVWETDQPFAQLQFKILVNDQLYEMGKNHTIERGTSMQIYPRFPHE